MNLNLCLEVTSGRVSNNLRERLKNSGLIYIHVKRMVLYMRRCAHPLSLARLQTHATYSNTQRMPPSPTPRLFVESVSCDEPTLCPLARYNPGPGRHNSRLFVVFGARAGRGGAIPLLLFGRTKSKRWNHEPRENERVRERGEREEREREGGKARGPIANTLLSQPSFTEDSSCQLGHHWVVT